VHRRFLNFSKLSSDDFMALSKDKPEQAESLYTSYVEEAQDGSNRLLNHDGERRNQAIP
jgi:hypothetical protein